MDDHLSRFISLDFLFSFFPSLSFKTHLLSLSSPVCSHLRCLSPALEISLSRFWRELRVPGLCAPCPGVSIPPIRLTVQYWGCLLHNNNNTMAGQFVGDALHQVLRMLPLLP